jgi:hypothetical protein
MKRLELFFSSPVDYENLAVEIQLDRERIAEINQEKGLEKLEIELFGTDIEHDFFAKLSLDDFLGALLEAREMLLKGKYTPRN